MITNSINFTKRIYKGITYEKIGPNKYKLSGTATDTSTSNIIQLYNTDVYGGTLHDHRYIIDVKCDNPDITIRAYYMLNGTIEGSGGVTFTKNNTPYTLGDATKEYDQILIRFQHASGISFSEDGEIVEINMLDYLPAGMTGNSFKLLPAGATDLNTIYDPGMYFASAGVHEFTNCPPSVNGEIGGWILKVERLYQNFSGSAISPRWLKQTLYTIDGYREYTRIVNVLDNWTPWILSSSPGLSERLYLPGGTNLNTFYGHEYSGIYGLSNNREYINSPISIGALLVFTIETTTYQIAIHYTTSSIYKRRILNPTNPNASWSEWIEIGGGGENVTNEYSFNNYQNTYNVTSTPTITTGQNNYLASTGDTTDRTNDITTMLSTTKVCNLGPGKFYVSGVVMPDSTVIKGSGAAATQIILLGTDAGAAISMKRYCQMSDLSIIGSEDTSFVADSTSEIGDRHGILWSGTYSDNENNSKQPCLGLVSNVRISKFTGGGITCYNTGYGTYTHISGVNIQIYNCNVGINISFWSEFHKFTNVRTYNCYYGIINNGGNNVFVNCDVSGCKLAFLMDNSEGQSRNNSHGSAIGCVFNHTDSNSGIGIKILGCDNGYIFEGCQIFFSQIYIEDSSGVVISNTNFGASNCDITVKNGGTVLFANNLHQAAPSVSVTNNSNVHFNNCYVRSTGAVVFN